MEVGQVMGRSMKALTEAQRVEVETLAAVLSTEQIADYLGIGRRTFWDMMARDDEIAARYKKGKARAIGAIAQGLISKARGGDTASMIFFLKTQAGWRETVAVETVPDPGAMVIDVKSLSDATLVELLAVMDRAAAGGEAIEGKALADYPEDETDGHDSAAGAR